MSTAVPLPGDLLEAVRSALSRWNRRCSSALAEELATLKWGLRTAVLLDSCSLSGEEAVELGTALQTGKDSALVVYEPVSGQTLVVNRDLLATRVAAEVAFVDVGGSAPALIRGPPSSFCSLLSAISSQPPSSAFLSLPSPQYPADLIPLVGFLLDYPVAYCLSHGRDGRNCLGGEELTVTDADLIGPDGTRQRLLAFSYPARLASSIRPDATLNELEAKLRSRLTTAARIHPELRGCRIEVVQRHVTLNQVAL